MVMSMRLFSGKKREARKQQNVKAVTAPVDACAKAPVEPVRSQSAAVAAFDGRMQPASRQQQPVRQTYAMGASPMKPAPGQHKLAYAAQSSSRTQSPLTLKQPISVSNSSPALDKYHQQMRSARDSNHRATSEERTRIVHTTAMSTPNRPVNIPVKSPPPSILHKPHAHTQQPTFSMDTPEPVQPHNRVRFFSSNSSEASSSCASEVHMMAGCGSVASSSAMSSSRGDGAENVFDRVLHSVMAEEENRLKAMGMSKAGSISSSLSPAMYYKSNESPGMCYRGGSRGPSSDDDVSPTMRPTNPGASRAAAAGQLIDIDTGMSIDASCQSGSVECEYHGLHDDDAIDPQKYRHLLSDSTGQLNGSAASRDSDRAINGNMASSSERIRSNDSRQRYQKPQSQYRKGVSRGFDI